MNEHTATPWAVKTVGEVTIHNGAEVVTRFLSTANAMHIVRCVNAHDELVAALQLIADSVESMRSHEYVRGIARAALAKVAK